MKAELNMINLNDYLDILLEAHYNDLNFIICDFIEQLIIDLDEIFEDKRCNSEK